MTSHVTESCTRAAMRLRMNLQLWGCELVSAALLPELRWVTEPSHACLSLLHLISVFQAKSCQMQDNFFVKFKEVLFSEQI